MQGIYLERPDIESRHYYEKYKWLQSIVHNASSYYDKHQILDAFEGKNDFHEPNKDRLRITLLNELPQYLGVLNLFTKDKIETLIDSSLHSDHFLLLRIDELRQLYNIAIEKEENLIFRVE